MTLQFIDNFTHPIELPAGQEEVMVDLPIPESDEDWYLLTVTDSATAPTRFEIVEAGRDEGSAEAWIWRGNMPDDDEGFPAGSVIFCAANSEALGYLVDELRRIDQRVDSLGTKIASEQAAVLVPWIARIELPNTSRSLWMHSDIRVSEFVESVVFANVWEGDPLLIRNNGVTIKDAQLKSLPGLTYTLSPDRSQIAIESDDSRTLMMRIQQRGWHVIGGGVSVSLFVEIEEVSGNYTFLE